MYKIAFFKRDNYEPIPVKFICGRKDTDKETEEKAISALINFLEDRYEAIDYSLIEIKILK